MPEWRFSFNHENPSELDELRAIFNALRHIRAPGDHLEHDTSRFRRSEIIYTHPSSSDPDQYRTILTRFADALGGETLRQERNQRALDQQMAEIQQYMNLYQGPMEPIVLESLALTAPVATPAQTHRTPAVTSLPVYSDVSMESILEGMRLMHESMRPDPAALEDSWVPRENLFPLREEPKLDLKLLKTKPNLVPPTINKQQVEKALGPKTRFDLIDDFG